MNIFNKSHFNTILIYFTFSLAIISAQTITNTEFLENYANEMENEYLRNRAEVEQYALDNDIPIRQELPDGTVVEMHHIENGIPFFNMTTNAGAAQTTRANELWPSGSVGSNVTGSAYNKLGEWDGGGVLTSHTEFSGRVTQKDSPSSTHYHPTHVAGTLVAAGVVAAAKGMAYEANLDAYDWNNDISEMASAAAVGMEESNHSYILITGWKNDTWYGDVSNGTVEDANFGIYSSESAAWDNVAFNAPNYLIVKAAGNERGENYTGSYHYHINSGNTEFTDYHGPDGGASGFDCIPRRGVAKNILTVGAVEEVLNYAQPSDVVMSYFSSWGPTDDGRIKPDIVGKGVDVYSTLDGTSGYMYYSLDGTSMASPNVTGTLALLQQHYQNTHSSTPMRSATLKGLAIHTADEAGQTTGPDYMFGWGLLNAETAGRLINLDSYGNDVIDEQVLSNGSIFIRSFNSDGNSPIKVTICWTDPAGTPVSSNLLNNRTPMLVNDLDLKITNGGSTYYPWQLDPANPANAATNIGENNIDNVEQVFIGSPTAGTYTIEVSHDGTLSGGSQAFSIIVSGDDNCQSGSIMYNTSTNVFNFCEEGYWVEK